jgi:hypothetical protein
MKTVVTLLLSFLLLGLEYLGAQPNEGPNASDSLAWVKRDTLIDRLVSAYSKENRVNGTVQGYRIQVYSGSGNDARQQANDIRKQLLLNRPDLAVHLVYQPPNFKVRAGDCRTELEATRLKRELSFDYPQGFVVRDDILLPRLSKEYAESEGASEPFDDTPNE